MLLAPQVEVAVAQPHVSSTPSSSSWNGSGSRAREDLERSTWSSTSPVGRFGLTASGARRDDLALGVEDELVADRVRDLRRLGRALRVDDELASPCGRAGR